VAAQCPLVIAPYGIKDNTRGVQVVGADGEKAAYPRVFPNHRHRQVAQPKGFLDDNVQFSVSAQQVACGVLNITARHGR